MHDSANWDALAVRCSQSDSAMSAQAWRNSTHVTMHCNRARKQTGELVAMLVEEPLPSRVNPSGRLDFLLRAHPPSFSPLRHNHSSAQPQRCRKPSEKHANLQSGDTDEAARSHWDHEGPRAGADEYAQLNVKHQMTAASEVDYLLYYKLYGKARRYKFEVYCRMCGKMILQNFPSPAHTGAGVEAGCCCAGKRCI